MSQLELLSSDDKEFVAVHSAPENYSGDLALLLCFAQDSKVCTACFRFHTLIRFQQPNVENVSNILLELLEDGKPIAKRPSSLMEFSACLLQQQTYADFKNPDRYLPPPSPPPPPPTPPLHPPRVVHSSINRCSDFSTVSRGLNLV